MNHPDIEDAVERVRAASLALDEAKGHLLKLYQNPGAPRFKANGRLISRIISVWTHGPFIGVNYVPLLRSGKEGWRDGTTNIKGLEDA